MSVPPAQAADGVACNNICTGIWWDSPGVPGASEDPARGLGAGPEPVSPAAGLWSTSASARSPSVSASGAVQPAAWYGGPSRPSLAAPPRVAPRLPFPSLRSSRGLLALPGLPCRGWVWGRGAGGVPGRSPRLSPRVSLSSLVRPPVALTWARRGALPAKQWPPGRPGPRSGRGKDPRDPPGRGLGEAGGAQGFAGPEEKTPGYYESRGHNEPQATWPQVFGVPRGRRCFLPTALRKGKLPAWRENRCRRTACAWT